MIEKVLKCVFQKSYFQICQNVYYCMQELFCFSIFFTRIVYFNLVSVLHVLWIMFQDEEVNVYLIVYSLDLTVGCR